MMKMMLGFLFDGWPTPAVDPRASVATAAGNALRKSRLFITDTFSLLQSICVSAALSYSNHQANTKRRIQIVTGHQAHCLEVNPESGFVGQPMTNRMERGRIEPVDTVEIRFDAEPDNLLNDGIKP